MSTITATVSTTISPLPSVLDHADIVDIATQDQFTTEWEAFNTALSGTTIGQINAVGDQIDSIASQMNTVSGEVNTNALNASAASTAALLTANAVAWVSGTNYGVDENAISQIDHQTYRRIIAGAGTTDPSSDLTNWVKLGFNGGTVTSEILANAGLTITGDLAFTQVDKGTVSTGTVTFTQSSGNVQRLQVGGALTIATSGWHTSGTFSDLVLQLVNAGSASVTLPTVNWIKPDGSVTTTFSTYLTAIQRPSLQSSGVDFMYLFTVDGGTTLYGKLI